MFVLYRAAMRTVHRRFMGRVILSTAIYRRCVILLADCLCVLVSLSQTLHSSAMWFTHSCCCCCNCC